jgi:hypothetical protein
MRWVMQDGTLTHVSDSGAWRTKNALLFPTSLVLGDIASTIALLAVVPVAPTKPVLLGRWLRGIHKIEVAAR